MIVVVTGGRDYTDQRRVDEALDAVHEETPIELLGHGDADGADSLAAAWAERRGVPVRPFPADWRDIDTPPVRIKVGRYGPYNALAGLKRNIEMLEQIQPHMVVAFPGNNGTMHCRQQAFKRHIPVLDVDA